MSLATDLQIILNAQYTKAATIQGVFPLDPLAVMQRITLATGTGAGQADKLYYVERTIAPSANDDLDLTGTLVDNLGQTFTIARIKMLMVLAKPSNPLGTANVNNVVVGAAGANQWATLLNAAGTITLRPGAYTLNGSAQADATGYVVTGGTGDILRIANGGAGTSVVYQIFIVASSA